MKQLLKMIAAVFSKRSKRDMQMLRMQVYLLNVLRSDAFSKLTLQDKLSSIAKLTDIFQRDFGFTPKEVQKMITILKNRLDANVATVWEQTYTHYFSRNH